MTTSLLHRVRLIEITNELDEKHGPRKRVVLAFYPREDIEPMITMAWHLDPGEYDDASLIPLARHYFHGIAEALSEATAEWSLDAAALEALKKVQPPHPVMAYGRGD